MAIEMGIKDLNMYGESQLVINQLLEEYEVKKEDFVPYHKHAFQLLDRLDIVNLEHVPRGANTRKSRSHFGTRARRRDDYPSV